MTETTLSRTEWAAVAVALRDAERYGRGVATDMPPGPLARLWRLLSGAESPRPLADPRLDAIRRFVCVARHRGGQVRDLVPELLGYGFSPAQVEALRRVAA